MGQTPSRDVFEADHDSSHLFVLVHGLYGGVGDFKYIAGQLRAQGFAVLRPACNSGLTHDGIQMGGNRVAESVQMVLDNNPELTNVSFIGHSLGGLYARVAARVLMENQTREISWCSYVSLATPHLGSRQHMRVIGRDIANFGISLIAGETGTELLLEDEKQFLLEMTRGAYLDSLSSFKKLILYANYNGDLSVSYSTAAISIRKGSSSTDTIFDIGNDSITDLSDEFRSNPSLAAMLVSLRSLPWQRYAVKGRPVVAHTDIVVKNEVINGIGKPIIAHMIELLSE